MMRVYRMSALLMMRGDFILFFNPNKCQNIETGPSWGYEDGKKEDKNSGWFDGSAGRALLVRLSSLVWSLLFKTISVDQSLSSLKTLSVPKQSRDWQLSGHSVALINYR